MKEDWLEKLISLKLSQMLVDNFKDTLGYRKSDMLAQAIRTELKSRLPEKIIINENKSMMESMDKMDCTFDSGDCREIGFNNCLDLVTKAIEE